MVFDQSINEVSNIPQDPEGIKVDYQQTFIASWSDGRQKEIKEHYTINGRPYRRKYDENNRLVRPKFLLPPDNRILDPVLETPYPRLYN